jgi:hypothetical protein
LQTLQQIQAQVAVGQEVEIQEVVDGTAVQA